MAIVKSINFSSPPHTCANASKIFLLFILIVTGNCNALKAVTYIATKSTSLIKLSLPTMSASH